MTDQPRFDPTAASLYARTHAREKGCPPHWTRCEWMLGGKRCRLGEHPKEIEHQFEEKK